MQKCAQRAAGLLLGLGHLCASCCCASTPFRTVVSSCKDYYLLFALLFDLRSSSSLHTCGIYPLLLENSNEMKTC